MWFGHVWLQHDGAPAHFILIICNILNKRFVGRLSGCHLPTTLLSHKYFSICNTECIGTSGCVWNATVHYWSTWCTVTLGKWWCEGEVPISGPPTSFSFFLLSFLYTHTHTHTHVHVCPHAHAHANACTHAVHSRECSAVWVQNMRVNRDYMCMFTVDMLIGYFM